MAQPTPYDRQANFTNEESLNPTGKTPGTSLDAEFNSVKVSLDQTQANLALIQRDDGALKNGSVGYDQLASSLSVGFTLKGAWSSPVNYIRGDGVTFDNSFYSALSSHLSVSGQTPDIRADLWQKLVDFNEFAPAVIADGGVTTVKLADTAVTTAKLADTAVTTAKLASDAVTPVKTALGALVPLNLGTLAAAAANALTLTAQGADGAALSASNRAVLPFRSATATSGDVVTRNRVSADAITIPAGATLGVSAINTAFSIWLVDVDDNGTLRRGVINCLSGLSVFPLNAGRLLTSTLIADTADSAHVLYTAGAAVATPRAILPVARLEWSSGLATLGNWTAPTRIDPYVFGMKLPGDTVQTVATRFTTYSSTATPIPVDGTIPQNTEGTRLANVAFSAVSAANLAFVRGEALLGTNAVTTWASATLCRSDQANCLNANGSYIETSGVAVPVPVTAVTLCGTTSALTYDYRAGPSTGGYSVFYNGVSTAQIYGTGTGVSLVIEEIQT